MVAVRGGDPPCTQALLTAPRYLRSGLQLWLVRLTRIRLA